MTSTKRKADAVVDEDEIIISPKLTKTARTAEESIPTPNPFTFFRFPLEIREMV